MDGYTNLWMRAVLFIHKNRITTQEKNIIQLLLGANEKVQDFCYYLLATKIQSKM